MGKLRKETQSQLSHSTAVNSTTYNSLHPTFPINQESKIQEYIDPAAMPSNSANTKDNEGTQSLDKELQNPTVELSSSTGVISEVSTARCSYRDFSQVLGEKNAVASVAMSQTTTAKEPTFPIKLHMILSNPEFQDIISWLPHGRSWRILQQKAFEERVIPLYFRHGRYSSFARQVNGWGFRRVTHGSDYNSYYHEVRWLQLSCCFT